MGCYGMDAYNTTDSRYPVHFSYTNAAGASVTALSVPHGAIAAAPGNPLEIRCPAGYRIHADEPSDAQMATFAKHDHCSPSNDNCTLNRFLAMPCSRLTCGNFSMPNMSASGVRAEAASPAFARADLLQTVLYMENITITCDAGHRIAAAGLTPACDVRSFNVECHDNGGFLYRLSDGTSTTSVPVCVPIMCNVDSLPAVNGVKSPQAGMLRPGETVNVTCDSSYRVVNNSTTALSRCSDAGSFLATCEDATCTFAGPGPFCKPVGCDGMQAGMLKTNDTLFDVTFEYKNQIMSHAALAAGGVLQHGVDLQVTCPLGYRVSPEPLPISIAPQSVTISCPAATCELPSVSCHRRVCASMRMADNSAGARHDPIAGTSATALAGGDTISGLLYGQVVTVACDASYRLPGSTVCSSTAQNFSYECSDDDPAVPYGLRYLPGWSSSTMPHEVDCEPVTCSVADVVAENGVRWPASGVVQDTRHSNVTCNSGFLLKPLNVTRHPVCGDATSYSLTCTGCNFPDAQDQPRCEQRGCWGTSLNLTEDGLRPVTYSYDGTELTTDIAHGDYVVGERVRVDCPEGYRVPTTLIYRRESIVDSAQADYKQETYERIGRTTGPPSPDKVTVTKQGTKTKTVTISEVENEGWTDPHADYKEAGSEPDARFAYSECTSEACGMTQVTCRRLACGNFTIPPNATAAFGGNAVSVKEQFMLFNDTLTITCAEGYILSTSSFEDCEHSYTVRCNDDGHFESQVPVETRPAREITPGKSWARGRALVQCVPAKKRIHCAECRKSWGVGPDVGEPKFPAGFAALDCTVGHCDPPHGIGYYEVPRDPAVADRCQVERGFSETPCLPVQCRPLPVPHGAARIEMGGQMYEAHPNGNYPTTLCGEVVRVYCGPDFAPEEMVNSGTNCTHNYFNMTCDGRGFWTGYQRCVPKACVIAEEHMSYVVAPGQTYEKPCPVGAEVVAPGTLDNSTGLMVPAPLPVCQRNCQLSVQQQCEPWNCSAYTPGLHVDNSTVILRAGYGQTTTVRCADGYAAQTPGVVGCMQNFHPVCQEDRTFDRQNGQQCFPTACPAYHMVADNIKVTALTGAPAAEGQSITAQCKDDFGGGMGYGFNDSAIPHSNYAVRGSPAEVSIACESACTWNEYRHCVAVPCKCMTFSAFSSDLKSPQDGSVNPILHSSETDGVMDPLETKALQCPKGYEQEGTGGTLTCQNDCSLAISGLRCVPKMCRWGDLGLGDFSRGVKAAPAASATMLVGQTVTVECEDGFELSMEAPPAEVVKKIPGLEALGNVKVLSEKSFPKPDTSKDVSYGLDGVFSNVKLELPAGAWPEDLGEGPSMTVFELPPMPEEPATDGKKPKKVAGKCINFGPEGVKFSKPVAISLPLDLSTLDLTGMMLRPHRFNPDDSSWTEIALPEGYEVPSFPNCLANSTNSTNATECRPDAPPPVIKGATMSFSAYAALSVPDLGPGSPASETPQPAEEEEEEKDTFPLIPVLVGCGVGFIVIVLLMAAYIHFKNNPSDAKTVPMDVSAGAMDVSAAPHNMRDQISSPVFPANSPQVVTQRALAGLDSAGPQPPPRTVATQPGSRGLMSVPLDDDPPQPPPRLGPASIAGSV